MVRPVQHEVTELIALIEERGTSYGDPRVNHDRIADLWGAYLGTPITAHQVAICQVLLKLSRMRNDPHHLDNYDDAHAYLKFAQDFRE